MPGEDTIAAEHCLGPLLSEASRRGGPSLGRSCCKCWWMIGAPGGANLVAVHSVGRQGWVAEIRGRFAGCAHPLEKSATGFKNTSIHRLAPQNLLMER